MKWSGSKNRYRLPCDPGPMYRAMLRAWYWIEDCWRELPDEDKILIVFVGLLIAFWYWKLR